MELLLRFPEIVKETIFDRIVNDIEIKKLPGKASDYLYEIIIPRNEPQSTIMTLNQPLGEWGKLLGNAPNSIVNLDPILHPAEIIQFTGDNYRLKDRARTKRANDKDNQDS